MANSVRSRMGHLDSRSALIVVFTVAILSYLAPRMEGALISDPQTVWPLWPGCAILVSALLLVPLRIWPILIAVAFTGFVLYDLEVGVAVRSIAWFMLADTVQVLIAALGLKYFFNGVPRFNSPKALAEYAFVAVILAPFTAAFLSARGIQGDYWNAWKITFFSEVLAFVTLAPAILSWISEGPSWVRRSRAYHLAAIALFAGLVLLSYFALMASEQTISPALLYSLVPFLLCSALFFGSMGISTSVLVVAFLSIWGAVHGRGPFNGGDPHSIRSLQLFLIFAATPFMVLAALVEDRRLASKELALAKDRLLLAMEAGTSIGWDLDISSGRGFWFGNLHAVFGIPSDTHVGEAKDFIRYVHPDDRQRISDALADARLGNLYAPEFRIVRPDGTIRWLVSRGEFYCAEDDNTERILGVSLDITERKLAQEAVSDMSRKLITSQEQERSRIGRELHDDIVQRLALLAIELDNLQQEPGLLTEAAGRLGGLQKQISEIATDVQSLSHELHSSKLEYLSLPVAMRSFCEEFAEHHKMEIVFHSQDLPSSVPSEISLCVFRILQEALQNSAKHSGTKYVEVRLFGTSTEIDCTVRDFGAGFEVEAAKQSRGLGLISMQERIRLVKGQLSIQSQPSRGTTIYAQVPLPSENESLRIAG